MADNDDIVMVSPTDTPDQIAEGLSAELRPVDGSATEPVAHDASAADVPADDLAVLPADASALSADAEADVSTEVGAPSVPEVPQGFPNQGTASKRRVRTPDSAAAAARRKASAETKVLKDENDALRRRLAEVEGAAPASRDDLGRDQPAAKPPAAVTISAEDITDEHPAVARVLAGLTKLEKPTAKPKQEDFADFAEFEAKLDEHDEKKLAYHENRARILARADIVREDVARSESIAQTEANRAAQATAEGFKKSLVAAKGRYADYDATMEAARVSGASIPEHLRVALFESPIGADLTYWLAKNPKEVARISGLSQHRALVEIGAVEARLQARIKPAMSTVAPHARTSQAPDPPSTLLGELPTSTSSAKTLEERIQDPNLSLPEYNRLRDEIDRRNGRGRR